MTLCAGCGRPVQFPGRFHLRLSDATTASRQVMGGPLCTGCFDAVSEALAARERDVDARAEVGP